ncbi:hypothetical protein SESI111939_20070 [Serratia silvae]
MGNRQGTAGIGILQRFFCAEAGQEQARQLSVMIESTPLVFEAHSTDYQTPKAFRQLVRDHFAILKVGPALIEKELIAAIRRR